MLRSPKIVVLSTDPAETGHLQEVLSKHAVLTYARNLSELKTLLKEGEPDVLFCSWSFQSVSWKEAVEEVQHCYPELPVIVLSRTADEREWMEALEVGDFDLLIPTYGEKQSLLAVVEQAAASRETRARENYSPLQKEKAAN